MSKISDLAKQGIYYTPMEAEAVPVEESGDFVRGLKKAAYQLPQTAGGAVALAGDLVGSDGMREYGMGVYKANEDKIHAITKDSDSLSSVLEGDADAVDWLQNASGYAAGQAVTALATGGAGGFIGAQLAKRGIREVVARGAQSAMARDVAGKVASRGAKIGALGALVGHNVVQEAGSIYPEAVHQAELEGRTLDGGDKARVVGSALGAAAVDTAMDALMLGRVLKGGRKPGESMASAALREIPGGMAREGVTEGIQSGIERYGAGKELSTADAVREYVDSIGVGMVGGGQGGALSVLHSQKVPESGPLTRAANAGIDEEILRLTNDPTPMISFPDGSAGTKAELEAYLKQFPEENGARNEARAKLMGLGPQEEVPEPTSAPSDEAEKTAMTAWASQHEPETLDYALAMVKAPGTKGQSLMVAPHPAGGGYTVVPSNMLTLDTQAKLAELQKPPKADTKEKSDAPVPAQVDIGAGSGGTAGRSEPADGAGLEGTGPVSGLGRTDAAGSGGKGNADPVRAGAAADAKPALADPDPYARNIFHSTAVAEAFMKRKALDPTAFEVVPTGENRWGVKPKAPEKAALDAAAHEAATSPTNDLPEPTQAQKEAGNYKVGKVRLHGLDISIENPAGSVRKGVDKSGKPWENELAHHYGYIKRTLGADGDHVDAFVGGNLDSDRAFIVDQIHPDTGKFDEHKILLGFDSLDAAKAGYQANYAKGWKGAKDVTETSVEGFKAWLNEGDTTKPFAPQTKENTDGQENNVPADIGNAAVGTDARSAETGGDNGGTAAGTAPADAATGGSLPASVVQSEQEDGRTVAKKLAAWQEKEAKKESRLQAQIATATANAATRAAEKGAKAQSVPAGNESAVIPSDNEIDDGKDIPTPFFKKVKVSLDVWVVEENSFDTIEVPAKEALTSVREDIDNLKALLKCMKG